VGKKSSHLAADKCSAVGKKTGQFCFAIKKQVAYFQTNSPQSFLKVYFLAHLRKRIAGVCQASN
jgi:hypothetical protein